MYFKVIACGVFRREMEAAAADCGNRLDITWLEQGLHTDPRRLRGYIAAQLKAIDGTEGYDAVLLCYGLCGQAATGLCCPVLPLVMPRAHDCIGLLMGSSAAYLQDHAAHPDTFYYSSGFAQAPCLPQSEEQQADRLAKYLLRCKGNEKLARKVMRIEDSYTDAYHRLAHLQWPSLPDDSAAAQKIAAERGWQYDPICCREELLRSFLRGDWPEKDFLLLQPGEHIVCSYDERIFVAE